MLLRMQGNLSEAAAVLDQLCSRSAIFTLPPMKMAHRLLIGILCAFFIIYVFGKRSIFALIPPRCDRFGPMVRFRVVYRGATSIKVSHCLNGSSVVKTKLTPLLLSLLLL